MERIKKDLAIAGDWAGYDAHDDHNKELGLAVRIAFGCTSHVPEKDRHELLVEAVYEKVAQDLGHDEAADLFEKFAEMNSGPRM
jgi:hypothetical protein